jgi:hypothetical protein
MSPWVDPSTHTTGYKITSSDWNQHTNNFLFLAELGYAEFTSTVTSAGNTVGTATQIVSLGAITYEAVPIMIEFSCARTSPASANSTYFVLRDGTTVLGTIAEFQAGSLGQPVKAQRRLTPTAASHTYNVAFWVVTTGTATATAGTGGAAGDSTARMPGWIRATAIPT